MQYAGIKKVWQYSFLSSWTSVNPRHKQKIPGKILQLDLRRLYHRHRGLWKFTSCGLSSGVGNPTWKKKVSQKSSGSVKQHSVRGFSSDLDPGYTSLPSHAQVVVCGGGVVGCSVALHLAMDGIKDVVLLEQGR